MQQPNGRSHATRPAALLLAALVALPAALAAETLIMNTRSTALAENPQAPPMRPEVNTDRRQVRNYPDQPPVIPHKVEGYVVDRNFNKCLTCHDRGAIEVSQAPMISITHYMDRDGQSLASVSPRRYFCNQCHVSQTDVLPPVANTFVDMDELIEGDASGRAQ